MTNKILARTLLSYTTDQLWEMLTGEFTVVFDDGEIQTNHKEVLYSSYGWDIIRMFPNTPILKRHHIRGVIGDGRLGSKTHLKLLGNIAWDVHEAYFGQEHPSRDLLAKLVYEKTNLIYNDLSYRQESHVVSLDITDFIQVSQHPKIKEVMDNVQPNEKSIDNAYTVIKDTLSSKSELINNPIANAVRASLVNMGQVLQCVGPRGYVTDVDSNQFPKPITRGFVQGFRSLHDIMLDSRSAAKALYFSKVPLQDAEYFSRRLQLLCQTVQNLHHCDCGSTKYLHWKIRPSYSENGKTVFVGDLTRLEGKYYLDEETNTLKAIKPTDTHLIDKTLRIRSVIAGCAHPDPYGICSTCFGELSFSVPDGTNIGHACSTHMTQQSSQMVLSVKHLDGNVSVDAITLTQEMVGILKVSNSGSSYLLSEKLRNKKVALRISSQEANSLTDIDIVKDLTSLNISRISELTVITVQITDEHGVVNYIPLQVSVNRRKASMTYALLNYIKEKRWGIDDKGCYIFDMSEWDFSKEILTLPLKHFNTSDHSEEIAGMIESSVTKMRERDHVQNPQAVLVELCDFVNSKLNVNLAVLEVTLYAATVISMENENYALPKAWTTAEMGVSDLSIENRSLSAAMAYEEQKKIILSPRSFVPDDRQDHPLDCFLCPREVIDGLKDSKKGNQKVTMYQGNLSQMNQASKSGMNKIPALLK